MGDVGGNVGASTPPRNGRESARPASGPHSPPELGGGAAVAAVGGSSGCPVGRVPSC